MHLVAACWTSRMVVVREVDLHAAWKSAHTHFAMYVQVSTSCLHTQNRRRKHIDAMHHLYVFVSQRGGGGGGEGLGRND